MDKSIALSAMRLQGQSCVIRTGNGVRFPHNDGMSVEWIREGLEKKGKSQAGLARALGISPSQISRLMGGKRQLKASEIPKVKQYLGEPEDKGFTATGRGATNDGPEDTYFKVLGMAEGGTDGWAPFNGETVQIIRRPDNLLGVPNAYAVFIKGSSMEPRYRPGELVHVHPGKPVRPGDFVLVQRMPPHEGDTPLAVVKLLLRRTATKLILGQYTPAREIEIPAGEVLSIHRVVGSSET